jgi:hypothetical protein
VAKNLFPKAKEGFLGGDFDLANDDVRIIALNGYTYDANDVYLADVLAGSTEVDRMASGLTGKTITDGSFKASDPTLSAVDNGDITDIVVYKVVTNDADSPVIYHTDEDQAAAAINLPTNGSDVLIDLDALGLFDL